MKLKDNFTGLNEKLIDSQKKEVKSFIEEYIEDDLNKIDNEDIPSIFNEVFELPKNRNVKLSFGVTDKTAKFLPKYQVYKSSKK